MRIKLTKEQSKKLKVPTESYVDIEEGLFGSSRESFLNYYNVALEELLLRSEQFKNDVYSIAKNIKYICFNDRNYLDKPFFEIITDYNKIGLMFDKNHFKKEGNPFRVVYNKNLLQI